MKAMFKPKPDHVHRDISLRWLGRIQPTLIDQWPADILALSMPTKFVRVPEGLLQEFFSLLDGKSPGPVMDALAVELDAHLGWDRHFVRLNSRSPKDWPYPFDVPATISGKEALSIMGGSERVLDDLYEFSWVPEQPAYICLREWVYWIRPEWEFRCFVKDRILIAVTHYDYRKSTPAMIVENAAAIRAAIDTYFTETLLPRLHVDTVVFDLAFKPNRGDALDTPLLIELNPYGLSDPCWLGSYEAVENATSLIEVGTV